MRVEHGADQPFEETLAGHPQCFAAGILLTLGVPLMPLVEEQSFIAGRDAFITPPESEQREVLLDQETGITEVLSAF